MKHLLVTNDFPPKVGGIQSYLWELWRRLPGEEFSVLTTRYQGDRAWDSAQPFEVRRTKQWWLLPTPRLLDQINTVAEQTEAQLIVLDPVVPLGVIGPKLERPYVAIAHGAEYVIPARLPVTSRFVSNVTKKSVGMIASGDYVAEAVRGAVGDGTVPVVSIPPGVDSERFRPLAADERSVARARWNIDADTELVVGVSRLVPRKGFDRLVIAAARLRATHPNLRVLIAGDGRDRGRLERLVERHRAPVTLLGRVRDDDLPALYGAADVFCMPCHDRWFGLEREGFGIVFCEASAAGTPSVAGLSGGSGEAVLHGVTGQVVQGAVTAGDVASALHDLLTDDDRRQRMAEAGRARAATEYSYDHLAGRLREFLVACGRR